MGEGGDGAASLALVRAREGAGESPRWRTAYPPGGFVFRLAPLVLAVAPFATTTVSCGDDGTTGPGDTQKISVSWSRLPGRLAYSRVSDVAGGGSLYVADGTRREVELVDRVGGGSQTLQFLAWTTDGRIAYSQLPFGCCEPWSLYTIATTGGEPQLLYSGGAAGAWSRDGRVAYTCLNGGLCVDGESVLHGETTVFGSRPAWEADGERLIFALDSRPGSNGLYVLDTRTGAIAPFRLSPNDSVIFEDPLVSPDGGKLVFTLSVAYVAGSDIWVVNMDGTGAKRLTTGHVDSQPAWSPDGSEIAFLRDGGAWLMSSDGGDVERIIGGSVRSLAWSR